MAKKKRPKDTPEKQHARFVEAAKAAEADESPDALEKGFKKLSIRQQAPYSRGKAVKP